MQDDATTPEATAEAAPAEASLLGSLDADERIRAAAEQSERTLWGSAALIALLYAALIAAEGVRGAFAPPLAPHKERRGQGATTISVELVPEPDLAARTRRWQDGLEAPAPEPSDRPPQQPQTAQPEIREAREPQQKGGAPALLDLESLVEAAAADLTRKIDEAFRKTPQKPRPERHAVIPGGNVKVRGTGASGRSDAFTRSVIAELMRTRPGPFALWGRVLVSFQISESGGLRYVKLLHSSGNSALDQAAIEAIRKARFERPPPGLSPEDRTYIIDYIFG